MTPTAIRSFDSELAVSAFRVAMIVTVVLGLATAAAPSSATRRTGGTL